MTISTTTSTITYQGNGATTVFSFPFVADSAADIVVTYTNALGVATILTNTQYTLIINAVPSGGLWGIGGTVTYPITGSPVIPLAAGTYITITRAVPYEQTVSINNQGAFYPQVVEQGLDILELQIQQLETDLQYSIKAPLSDITPPNVLPSASLRANGYLAFDSTGQPVVLFGMTPVSPSGSTASTRKVVVTTTSTINILTSDLFGGVSIYQSGTPVTTVQLPTQYGPYPIFDGSLNASTYPIKVLPPAGLLIEGNSSYYLVFNGQSATFFNDGTQIIVG